MKKMNKRIPGILPPPPKTEIDGNITDLSSKTIPELLELCDRQAKLLNNKSFISKLPDKGQKIQCFYDKIDTEIKSRQEEKTCRLFENMTLGSIDKQSVQNMEWERKVESKKDTYLDSDDDSDPEDVMQILSQRTALEKKVKVLKPDKPLVTPEDLVKIGAVPHIQYLVEKAETNSNPKVTGQFKPYKTTKTDVHNPEKEILRKKHKHWEITAATPPPIIHGPVKTIRIEESLKLQKEYDAHLKEIEAQQAAKKLLLCSGIKMAGMPMNMSDFGKYREVDSDDSEASDPEGSDKEVHDEEPDKGGVIYEVDL